jgi:hypothetical protein
MDYLGLSHHFTTKTQVNLTSAKDLIRDFYSDKWSQDIHTVPKLRTYNTFKRDNKCEPYVKLNLAKNERSLLCQLRVGILPLRIETGRYVGEAPEQRLCRFCSLNMIEDELHFILNCELYNNIRNDILGDLLRGDELNNLTQSEKLSTLMNSYPRKTAKFIVKSYLYRRSVLYSNP